MTPELDRRQRHRKRRKHRKPQAAFLRLHRRSLQVQRDIGTPGAVELLQNIGLNRR